MPCRDHLLQLWEQKRELDDLGVSVVMVTFESKHSASAYANESAVTWPILIDERRYLYDHYHMYWGSFWDIWGPSTWWAYMLQLIKGNLPKSTTGDINQRGGDVLIDSQGNIRLHHVGSGPADRPSVKSILEIIKKSGK